MASTPTTDAAEILFNVATILEIAGEDGERVRIYRKAARAMWSGNRSAVPDVPDISPILRRRLAEALAKLPVDEQVSP